MKKMDTPDKNLTPVSLRRLEDSPVFNYISNLSPFEPIKSTKPNNTMSLLTAASPSALFNSPQMNFNKESRFSIRRYQSPDPSKAGIIHCDDKKCDVSKAVPVPNIRDDEVGCLTPQCSAKEFGSAIKSPETLENDSIAQSVLCGNMSRDLGAAVDGAAAQYDKKTLKQVQHPFEVEQHLRRIFKTRNNEGYERCDLVTLVSDVAEAMCSEACYKKITDTRTRSCTSNLLHFPENSTHNIEEIESFGTYSYKTHEKKESLTRPAGIPKLDVSHRKQDILPGESLDELVLTHPTAELEGQEGVTYGHSLSKHSVRRRCLVFEKLGGHGNKPACDLMCSSSTSSSSACEVMDTKIQLIASKKGSNWSSSVTRGIGLHLNALSNTLVDGKIIKHQIQESGKKVISIRGSMSSPYLVSCQNFHDEPSTQSSIERDLEPSNDAAMAIIPETSEGAAGHDEFDYNNSKRKRHETEHFGDSSCKRCNCRRSKCLKLYCECFAAGLYCIQPCSCHDCFNNPNHQDKVIETRRQIEARNPLAFTPKVITRADTAEFVVEHNKTPASARHKTGCNCKRSSCLKKYCECFQGGVGCSINCRCDGCKNTFGRKKGCESYMVVELMGEDHENNDIELNSQVRKNDEQHQDGLSLDISKITSVAPSPSCAGIQCLLNRQPIFESHLQVIPKDDNTLISHNYHKSQVKIMDYL